MPGSPRPRSPLGLHRRRGPGVDLPDAAGAVLLLVGVGPADGVDPDGLRRAAGLAVRAARRVASLGLLLLDAVPADATPSVRVQYARAVGEGARLGAYAYRDLRSSPEEDVLTSSP